jgi:hypothetical protein
MFVLNVKVVNTEVIKYKKRVRIRLVCLPAPYHILTQRSQGQKGPPEREFFSAVHTQQRPDEDWYFPVQCATCGTEVATMDPDETYHFFNVIADDP